MKKKLFVALLLIMFMPIFANAKYKEIRMINNVTYSENTSVNDNSSILLTKADITDKILLADNADGAIDYEDLCSNNGVKKAFRIVGYVVAILKWTVPFIIIIFGMVDFGKSVIDNDKDSLSKTVAVFSRRLIAGFIVFFIPTILLALLNLFGFLTKTTEKFEACTMCLKYPADDSRCFIE